MACFSSSALAAEYGLVEFPAFGSWNGNLNQQNVVECSNFSARSVTIRLRALASTGASLGERTFSIAPNGTVHTILNDVSVFHDANGLGITDRYGIYRLELVSGTNPLIACMTAIYRMAADAPPTNPYPDYAFVLPVRPALTGTTFGMFNSINPTPGLSNATWNWLTVANPGTEPFRGVLHVRRQDGSLARSAAVDVPVGGRQDFQLHPGDTEQVTGLYEIVPESEDAPYGSFVTRYSTRDGGNSYDLGFALEGLRGSCGETLTASSMNAATNWLELGNPNDSAKNVGVEIRNRFGVVTHAQQIRIAPYQQANVFINPHIDPEGTGNVGSIKISCANSDDRLLAQSMFYGHDHAGSLQTTWAYASQALGAPRATAGLQLLGSANTFFHSANWLKVAHDGVHSIVDRVQIFDEQGGRIADSPRGIAGGGVLDFDVHTVLGLTDRVGTFIASSSTSDSSTSGELLRVFYRSDGLVAGIMRTPVAIVDPQLVAFNSTVPVTENQTKTFDMPVENGTTLDLTYEIISAPSHGSLGGSGFTRQYSPGSHYLGQDQFHFRVRSASGREAQASVQFHVTQLRAEFAGDPNRLTAYRDTLTETEVRELLKRVAMGGTPAMQNMRSLSQLVSALVDPNAYQSEVNFFDSFNQSRMYTSIQNSELSNRFFFGAMPMLAHQGLRYGNPFRNWMTFIFWHNHFANDLKEWSNSDAHFFMPEHMNRLKRAAFGQFRNIIFEMFQDLPYHNYLNNMDNTVMSPVENLGRELLELHTAGIVDPVRKDNSGRPVSNYSEADMETSTRAISGWRWGSNRSSGYRSTGGALVPPRSLYATDGRFQYSLQTGADIVQVRWDFVTPPATGVRVYRRTVNPQGNWELIGTRQYPTQADYNANSWNDTTAAPNTIYEYKARSFNTTTESADSNTDTGYRGMVGQEPPAPTWVSSTQLMQDRVRLSWSSVAGVQGYQVYRRAYDGGNSEAPIGPLLSPSTTTFDDFNVQANTMYRYTVRTRAASGIYSPQPATSDGLAANEAFGYALTPTTDAIPPVSAPAVSQGTSTTGIVIQWTPVANAASYRVWRARNYDYQTLVHQPLAPVSALLPASTTSFTDTTAPSGTRYEYMVTAYDANGRAGDSHVGARFNPAYWNNGSNNIERRTFLIDRNDPATVSAPGVGVSAFGDSFNGAPRVLSFLDHILYQWPSTRRQLGANLFAQLAHRNLTENLVDSLGQQMLETDFDYAEMSRRILSSSAMFSPESRGTCVQNPLEVVFSFMRLLNLPLNNNNTYTRVGEVLDAAGYSVFSPPNVFGWTNCGLVRGGHVLDGSDWILSAQTYISLGNGVSRILKAIADYEGMDLFTALIPSGVNRTSAPEVVDGLARRLGVQPNAAQRAILINYLNTPTPGSAAPTLWQGLTNQRDRLTGLTRLLIMSDDYLKK